VHREVPHEPEACVRDPDGAGTPVRAHVPGARAPLTSMPSDDRPPLRLVVVHRGEPPRPSLDPWASSDGPRALQLARAIATSEAWSSHGPATLVVRDGAEPLIAAVGRFDAAAEAWIEAAGAYLAATLPRVRLLDHRAVEGAATRLADALAAHYGRGALQGFRYAAVPRGGLLVLGALAYLLDLPHDRIATSTAAPSAPPDDAPLVLVDDVAVSGLRLARTLAARPEARVVVATLHAHPELRAALRAAHPRVEAFVAADDLHDHAPAAWGDAYAAWRDRWRDRADPGTLWIGQPDHVVYPWNEPDVGVWNPVAACEERGWRTVPPEHCLKRRAATPCPVQLMPKADGRLRPHPDVVAAEVEGRVVVGQLGSGRTFALEGTGADVWRALAATGDLDAGAARLAAAFGVEVAAVASDVAAFAAELLAADLLVAAAT
jgi:hypothetical protein